MEETTQYLELAEAAVAAALPPPAERPEPLSAAVRYAVESGGKRIRPQICLAAAVAAGGHAEDALAAAAAIELLHSYTLVHDDLPAMDGDVERRDRPTVWKRFGETTALLAGDALQALAFRAAARSPRNAAEVVAALSEAAVGVVRGQTDEFAARTAGAPPPSDDFVVRHKTADLFVAAAAMGALAAGASPADVGRLRAYALNLGLAFQYEDDLIDGDGTLPRDETERRVEETTAAAVAALDGLPGDAAYLRNLANRLKGRLQ